MVVLVAVVLGCGAGWLVGYTYVMLDDASKPFTGGVQSVLTLSGLALCLSVALALVMTRTGAARIDPELIRRE